MSLVVVPLCAFILSILHGDVLSEDLGHSVQRSS